MLQPRYVEVVMTWGGGREFSLKHEQWPASHGKSRKKTAHFSSTSPSPPTLLPRRQITSLDSVAARRLSAPTHLVLSSPHPRGWPLCVHSPVEVVPGEKSEGWQCGDSSLSLCFHLAEDMAVFDSLNLLHWIVFIKQRLIYGSKQFTLTLKLCYS